MPGAAGLILGLFCTLATAGTAPVPRSGVQATSCLDISNRPDGADEEASTLAVELLQAELKLQSRLESADEPQQGDEAVAPAPANEAEPLASGPVYNERTFWDLSPGSEMLDATAPGGCSLRSPNELISMGPTAPFALGECPQVLKGDRRPVRLGLDVLRDGTNAPGYNPSLIPLPEALKDTVPAGRWLAVLRVGDEHYPSAICKNPHIILSDAAWNTLPAYNLFRNPDIEASIAIENRTFRYLPRSYAAVLNERFELLARATITMRGGGGVWDDAAIQDARVFTTESGDVLIGFQPYYLQLAEPARSTYDWSLQEIVAFLHLSFDEDNGLKAWAEHKETRLVKDCPEKGFVAPGPKKNMGFFEKDGKVYALDWIYPTQVGELNLAGMDASLATAEEHYTPLCFGYEPEAPRFPVSPWQDMVTMRSVGSLKPDSVLEKLTLHNGTPLVWIEELGEYLGIGHLKRRFRRWVDFLSIGFYSQQFYTIAGTPAAGEPFAVRRLSPEFCFDSAQESGKCEIIQVATSLLRVGDSIQIGYGVMDCESFVTTISLSEVLALLRRVE